MWYTSRKLIMFSSAKVSLIGLAGGIFVVLIFLFFVYYQLTYGFTNPSGDPPTGSGSGLVPSGVVMFNSASATCPTGWTEYTEARGRYMVGLVSGGILNATSGVALSNIENRAIGQHTHAISDPGHTHTVYGKRVPSGTSAQITYSTSLRPDGSVPLVGALAAASTGITITASRTTAGTNAPYIQLLGCEKS